METYATKLKSVQHQREKLRYHIFC